MFLNFGGLSLLHKRQIRLDASVQESSHVVLSFLRFIDFIHPVSYQGLLADPRRVSKQGHHVYRLPHVVDIPVALAVFVCVRYVFPLAGRMDLQIFILFFGIHVHHPVPGPNRSETGPEDPSGLSGRVQENVYRLIHGPWGKLYIVYCILYIVYLWNRFALSFLIKRISAFSC